MFSLFLIVFETIFHGVKSNLPVSVAAAVVPPPVSSVFITRVAHLLAVVLVVPLVDEAHLRDAKADCPGVDVLAVRESSEVHLVELFPGIHGGGFAKELANLVAPPHSGDAGYSRVICESGHGCFFEERGRSMDQSGTSNLPPIKIFSFVFGFSYFSLWFWVFQLFSSCLGLDVVDVDVDVSRALHRDGDGRALDGHSRHNAI
jgi:hypothetical protein